MKKLLELLFHRLFIVVVLIAVQVAILATMILKFNDYFVGFYGLCIILSILAVLLIISDKSNPAYKIAWIIPIMLVPFFGGLFYLIFGRSRLGERERKRLENILSATLAATDITDTSVLDEINEIDPSAANQARYITRSSLSPIYKNTSTEYFPIGEKKFERMLEELKKAEHFIFLEYFIIQEGKMWNSILDILKEKAAQGVDVRVMYDDAGSILLLPKNYPKQLEAMGIKCKIFNPIIPVLSMKMNNRDHRKICVIDGHTGFTGGINLADEYINAYEKHGHWKDVAIMLKGEAVWNLTTMFLSMWDAVTNTTDDFSKYKPQVYMKDMPESDGYVQPFTDSPVDFEPTGETVYLNIINKAKKYVYINTPYLIIDNEMVTALCSAAKSGVDVRIVTPHMGDKWYVHMVTRAHYETLIEGGVKIYEYTPGFVHAKTFVSDDEYGVVGTINLDYRSLYLHFECAAWLYKTKSVLDLRDDYLKTLEVCEPITLEFCKNRPILVKFMSSVLRVFAPLM